MSEHTPEWTPGPWRAVFHTKEAERGICSYHVTSDEVLITNPFTVPADCITETHSEHRANARLIAAAPLLVEAAEEFRDCVLNERHHLEGAGLDNDQINAVLGLFDDTFSAALAAVGE